MKPASICASIVLAVVPALAQNSTSWVSSGGSDSNPCSRLAPCQTFSGAYAKTNAGGVIKAIDAGEYGFVELGRSISLDGNGVGAEIDVAAPFVAAILVDSGTTTIRDLTIHVPSTVDYGILVLGGDAHIENVVIVGAPTDGLHASTGTPVTSNANVSVKNLTVVGATGSGIFIGGASASIRDSVVRSSTVGIQVRAQNPAFGLIPGIAMIERTELSFNPTGLIVDNGNGGGATARISDSVVTNNSTGISAINGGQIITLRTNIIAGNTIDGVTPFSISLK